MQTKKSQPEGHGSCRKRGSPRFRHFLLTPGLGFLGLHRILMSNYCLTYDIKIIYSFVFSFIFDIVCHGYDLLRTSFGVFVPY